MRVDEFNSTDLTLGPLHLTGWWRPLSKQNQAWWSFKQWPPCKIDILPAYMGKITVPVWGLLQSPTGEDEFQLWYDGCFWDEKTIIPNSDIPLVFMREQWTRNKLIAKSADGRAEIVVFDEMEHGMQPLAGGLERFASGNGGEFEKFSWGGQDAFRVYVAVSFPRDFEAAQSADTPLPDPDDDGIFRYLEKVGGKTEYSMKEMRLAAFSFLWLCVEKNGKRRCVLDWPF
ncbi:MAG: hypothetical protein HC844_21680 [Tabrizicola sp.]|nr:hypothetical protein [Tabrizicola sp.]